MTTEEIRATFPAYTVYIFEENNEVKNFHTSEYYVRFGKNYEQCTEAMNKQELKKWREKQDKDLYQVAKILESERDKHSEISQSDFADRLRNISFDIDRLLEDIEQ